MRHGSTHAVGTDPSIEKATLILLVNDYVFSHARHELDRRDASRTDPPSLLPPALDAERYPALQRAIAAGVFAGAADGGKPGFTFGLDRILDGIGALIGSRPPVA